MISNSAITANNVHKTIGIMSKSRSTRFNEFTRTSFLFLVRHTVQGVRQFIIYFSHSRSLFGNVVEVCKYLYSSILFLFSGKILENTTDVAILSLADVGGARDVRPPVQILSISCSFWGILAKSYIGAPGGLAPSPRRNPGSATDSID